MTNFLVFATLLFAATSRLVFAEQDSDEVLSVPGYNGPPLCWKHFAGYLPTEGEKRLFYWYHEATSDSLKKPLILWLNGGPGCSSLGGMFGELGPFVVSMEQNVTLNPYTFNRVANVIFIEQPAGVGFSYPNGNANDTTTAADTVYALRAFLKKHPELQGREFYVMGESYGGHYVPNTAKQIQDTNAYLPSGSPDRINLIGFAVGNGYTDWELDFNANVPNGRFHAMCSQSEFEAAQAACDGNYSRCFWPRADVECPDKCGKAVQEVVDFAEDGSIDIYDIYDDVCLPGSSRVETQQTVLLRERRQALEKHLNLEGRKLRATISPVFPTCIDNSSATYLNRPDVQEAIHVRPGTIPNGKWSDCGNVKYDFNYESELPNYRNWVKQDAGALEILIYNGDADFILSHMGNAAWIKEGLQLPKTQEWSKWRGSDGQVAGYFEKYETANAQKPLTFLTVKGAGKSFVHLSIYLHQPLFYLHF